MRIFLSYASEDRDLAEQVSLALTGDGHEVFFDRNSLPPAGDFRNRIRTAVDHSDCMVFLISVHSVARGSFALTELEHAKRKWRHPKDRVLSVRIGDVPWTTIPQYLKAVTILEPSGDVAEATAVAVSQMASEVREPRKRWWPRLTITVSVTFGVALIVAVLTPALNRVLTPTPMSQVDPWGGVPAGLQQALGEPDTRASFDFDGDGDSEECRIVSGTPSYFLCSSIRKVFYGVIDDPGSPNWPRQWIDWDGDGWKDYCRIVGLAADALKSLRCSFGDGRTLSQSVTSEKFDVGYGYADKRHAAPAFELRDGIMQYCRITGSNDFDQYRPCLPSRRRGFGADIPGRP